MFRSGPNFCWRYSSEGHGNWYCGGSTIFTNNDYVPRVRWHLTYTSVVNIWIDKQISALCCYEKETRNLLPKITTHSKDYC
jgi:hypothetical protein